jgi:LmbE family N-acetylglucosaminyl deacetylase
LSNVTTLQQTAKETAMPDTLVVVAHPDDEVLGAGGTIARLRQQGSQVRILFLADGVSGRGTAPPEDAARRHVHAVAACELLGATIAGFHSFPDNRFDTVPLLELVRCIEDEMAAHPPTWILTHHAGDLNIDHQLTARAVLTAARPLPGCPVRQILAFRVPSSTEWSHPSLSAPFLPDTWIAVDKQLETLLEAYACYRDEVRPAPHARSRAALEHDLRLTGHRVGLPAAEAFMTLRRSTPADIPLQ